MNKFWVCLSSVLATLVGVSAVFAQTTDVDYELEEVVVTAELREVNLQKVSTSIQVTSGEELRKEGKRRIDEIMQGTVGIQMQESQNGVTFFVRGVDSGGAGGVTSAPVLVDGVAQSRNEAVRGGTLDLARAEVMRGPQSTTLGANALSGAVSLVSNKPVFNYEASTSMDIGNYHKITLEGVMNVPLADNQAIRLAYSSEKRDAYVSNGSGESDLRNVRLKYRWQPSDTLDIVGTVSHQNIGGNGVSQLTLLTYGRYVPWRNGPASQTGSTLNQYSICQNSLADPTLTSGGSFAGDCSVGGGSAVIQQQNSLVMLGALPYNSTIGAGQFSLPGGALYNTANAPMLQATVGNIIPEFLGYPTRYIPINDGTNFRTRENAWDDGSQYGAWSNDPFRNSNIELASVEINWTTDIGAVTFLPSYQSTHYTSLEPIRGGQAMGSDNYQRTKIADLRINSLTGGKLEWQAGLYYSDDRQSQWTSFMNMPGVGMGGMNAADGGLPGTVAGSMTSVGDPGQCNIGEGTALSPSGAGQYSILASTGGNYGLYADGTPTGNTPEGLMNNGSAASPYAQLVTTSPCYNWQYQPELNRLNKRVFFNTEYALLDTVRLIGGASYSDQTGKQLTYNIMNGNQYGPFATCENEINILVCNGNIDSVGANFRALDNPTVATSFSSRWTHTTYRAGLEWDVLPETMLYGVYSTGFNPGAFDAMQNTINPSVTLSQITAGWKSQALDNRIQFNGEAFLTEYQNRAIDGNVVGYSAGANPATCTVGMGQTGVSIDSANSGYCLALGTGLVKNFKSVGIDMDMTWLLTPVDRLSLTAEFMQAKYDQEPYFRPIAPVAGNAGCTQAIINANPVYNSDGTINNNYIANIVIPCAGMGATTPNATEVAEMTASLQNEAKGFVGTTLQNSPEFSATWNYAHNFLMSDGSRITPRIAGVYKTRYWSLGGGGAGNSGVNAIANAGRDPSSPYYLAWQQAYATWDGSVTWDKADGKFTVTGYVKNMTNEVVMTGFTYQYISIGTPRTWGATFTANF